MLHRIAERVVAGEHDAVGTEHLKGAQQRRRSGVAADGDVHVLADDVCPEGAPGPALPSTVSARTRENGKFSPICPTTICRLGCRD